MNGVVLLVGGLLLVAVIKLIIDRNGSACFSVLSPCFWSLGLDTIQNRPF